MAQHDYDLANQAGAAFRADLNSVLSAIVSQNSGATAPTTTFAGMWWLDTGTTIDSDGPWLRQRNSGNTAWLRRFKCDVDFIAALQAQSYTAFTTAGTAPAFTLTPTPAITAYAANQRFRIKAHAAGTTGSNTLNVSSLGVKNIKQYDATGAKVAGIIASGQLADVEYDGTDFVILDPLPSTGAVQASSSEVVNESAVAKYISPDLLKNSKRTCKAWVNFDGTLSGTITPRANVNVASVTKSGTGDYTLNFATAMTDANYALAGMAIQSGTVNTTATVSIKYLTTPTTTAVNIQVVYNGGVSAIDVSHVTVSAFGN